MSLPGFATSSFISLYLFIGKHYNLVSEISFDSCSIEYADFNHWLDISGFDRVRYDDEIKEVNIKYKQPEKIKFDLKDNWQAEIEFVFSRPRDYFEPVSQATIKQEPFLR